MYKAKEWLLLGLIFSGALIGYMDRAVFGVLAPMIQQDLDLDPAELGLALSSFSIGYTLFTVVGGWLADRFGPRRVLGAAMLIWSVFCALTGAVNSLLALLGVRFVFGVGEAPFTPATSKMTYSWFGSKRYAGAYGLASAGQPLGGAVAGPIVGVIAVAAGWRAAFVAVGAIGLVWLVAWMLLARDRPQEPEPELDADAPPALSTINPDQTLWGSIAHPAVVASAAGFFAYGYLLYFFLSWFPSYLSKSLHMDLAHMSLATAAPWGAGALGLVAGGYLSDMLSRLLKNEVLARKLMIVGGLAVAAVCVALAPQFRTPFSALTLMGAAIFFMYLTAASYTALAVATTPGRHIGSVAGYLVFVANVAGISAPIITGMIIKSTGDFNAAFLLAGAIVVSGAVAVALLASFPGRRRAVAAVPPTGV